MHSLFVCKQRNWKRRLKDRRTDNWIYINRQSLTYITSLKSTSISLFRFVSFFGIGQMFVSILCDITPLDILVPFVCLTILATHRRKTLHPIKYKRATFECFVFVFFTMNNYNLHITQQTFFGLFACVRFKVTNECMLYTYTILHHSHYNIMRTQPF